MPRLAELGLTMVAQAVVRYVALGERIEAHELTLPIVVNAVSAEDAAGAAPDAEVTEEVVVLKAARTQDEARRRAHEGDHQGAAKLLREAAEDLRTMAPDSARAEELRQQAEEMEGFGEMLAEGPMDTSLSKRMRYSSRGTQRGRNQRRDR